MHIRLLALVYRFVTCILAVSLAVVPYVPLIPVSVAHADGMSLTVHIYDAELGGAGPLSGFTIDYTCESGSGSLGTTDGGGGVTASTPCAIGENVTYHITPPSTAAWEEVWTVQDDSGNGTANWVNYSYRAGCTDESAENYDWRNNSDDGSCTYGGGGGEGDPPPPDLSTNISGSTITSWELSVGWGSSQTCAYSYDNGTFIDVDCANNGSDIPAPARGTVNLYLRGVNSIGIEGALWQTFTYDPPLAAPLIELESPQELSEGSWHPIINWADAATCEYAFDDTSMSDPSSADCSSDGSDIPAPSFGGHTFSIRGISTQGDASEIITVSFYHLIRPTVITGDAVDITKTSVTLGSAGYAIDADTDIYHFGLEWGTEATHQENGTYDGNLQLVNGSWHESGGWGFGLSGLTCGTMYRYRAFAVDSADNTGYGSSRTFTTQACDPPPIDIDSCTDLAAMNDDRTASYRLTTDLDCTAEGNDIIIGPGGEAFTGIFDGAGHILTIDLARDSTYAGLFTNLRGTVRDLWIAGSVAGTDMVGSLAGFTYSAVIDRVKSSATVTGSGDYVGGLVGNVTLSSYISDSYVDGEVTGNSYVGGITGAVSASIIQRSYFSGAVIGTGDGTGGIAGVFSNAALHNDFTAGTINGDTNIGGIVGRIDAGSDLSNDYWDSVVSGVSDCVGSIGGGDTGGCAAVNTGNSEPDYFRNNTSNNPFGAWDFSEVWGTTDGYPKLLTITQDVGSGLPGSQGSAEHPYLILTCDDLLAVNNDLDASYVLLQHLNCASWGTDVRIGTYGTEFTGDFDGTGHAIEIDMEGASYVGLFGSTLGATISNVRVHGYVSGNLFVGGLIGFAQTGTSISNAVASTTVTGSEYVGGLIGDLRSSTVADSYADSSVTGLRSGGLVGYLEFGSTISRSYATGNVSGGLGGGLVGQIDNSVGDSTIEDSFAVVHVSNGGVYNNEGGFFSTITGAATASLINDYWDVTGSAMDLCGYENLGVSAYGGLEDVCEGIATTGEDVAYFKNNVSSGPFAQWDFDTVWATTDAYPKLRAVTNDTGGSDPVLSVFAGGNGSSEDPYQIGSCVALASVNENLEAAYVLTTDLDCSGFGNDIMIGAQGSSFSGFFDGAEHTVTIALTLTEDFGGLFRVVSNAHIEDLTVAGSVIATDVSYVGAVAGAIETSELERVHADATVEGHYVGNFSMIFYGILAGGIFHSMADTLTATGTIDADATFVGGVAGLTGCESHIENSTSYATVTGLVNVGGFAGSDSCEGPGSWYEHVRAYGTVTGNQSVGGLIGYAGYDNLIDIGAESIVFGVEEVGGLIGSYSGFDDYRDGMLFHAYASSTVLGQYNIGGLIGEAQSGVISQSWASSTVASTIFGNTGGFIGSGEGITIRDSYVRSFVVSGDGGVAGGFAGALEDSEVMRSYAAGTVIVGAEGAIGGFSGHIFGGEITNSFWDTDVSGIENACSNTECDALGADTETMTDSALYIAAGWNFDEIWNIDSEINTEYPYLVGGEDEPYIPSSEVAGPVETILEENHYHGGGVAQGWNTDDNYWEYVLPFSFTFYGESYDRVYVVSNGYIAFSDGGDIGEYDVSIVEGIGVPVIFAYANDLLTNRNEGDDIYITDEGDGQVIFRWQATDIENDTSIANFEIVLKDDSTFEINYGPQTEPINDETAVGVNNGSGSYVASVYDSRTDFNELTTSSWHWEEETDLAPVVLTEVTPIATETSTADAVYIFSIDNPDDRSGSYIFADSCDGSLWVDEETHRVYFSELQSGHTYPSCSFVFHTDDGDDSNPLIIGSFTVVSESVSSPRRHSSRGNSVSLRTKTPAAIAPHASVSSPSVQDLFLASQSNEVGYLQTLLVAQNAGPAARALAAVGVTGYFGSYTRAALAEYQTLHGIVPVVGYFGPRTRAYMKEHTVSGVWW